MVKLSRLAVVPVVAGTALFAFAPTASAQPADPEVNVFEVEAHTLYCRHGGSQCGQPGGNINNLRFADATVFRLSPLPGGVAGYDAVGTPDLVHAVCATHYRDAAGHVHYRAIDFTGTSLSIPDVPSAAIHGRAFVAQGQETSRDAVGGMRVAARAANGDEALIAGVQVADNTDDSRVSGGFSIAVHGTVVDTDFATGTSTRLDRRWMTCSTDVRPVSASFPGPAPNVFSSEVNDTGDAS